MDLRFKYSVGHLRKVLNSLISQKLQFLEMRKFSQEDFYLSNIDQILVQHKIDFGPLYRAITPKKVSHNILFQLMFLSATNRSNNRIVI